MNIFNAERSNYYKAKKREILRVKEENRVVEEDALFVYHYGMSAYLELFPEAKGFGMNWHNQMLVELQRLKKKEMGQYLSGTSMAVAATKNKKSSRLFRRIIQSLTK